MKKQPEVVSVAVHFNTPDDCIVLLQSLSKMNYTNHRIVVVDNCSETAAFDKITRFIATMESSCPCEIIKNTSNVGFGGGINFGLTYAFSKYGSTYLHVINTDAEVVNFDYLQHLVSILENDETIGIIGPAVLKESRKELQNTILPFVSINSSLNFKHAYSNLSYMEEVPSIKDVECVNGVCFLTPSKVFSQVGGFDESYFMYGEEQDFCYALFKAGYRRVFWAGMSIVHYGADKEGGNALVDWRYVNVRKNQVRYLKKYHSFIEAFVLATLFSASLIIKYYKDRSILAGESLSTIIAKYFSCSFSAKG